MEELADRTLALHECYGRSMLVTFDRGKAASGSCVAYASLSALTRMPECSLV